MSEYELRSPEVVAKFGGTSMANPDVVASIVEARDDQRVIVVSAPGVAKGFEQKMTDQLIDIGRLHENGQHVAAERMQDSIISRFESMYNAVDVRQRNVLQEHARNQFAEALQASDPGIYFASLGEELSARYFAARIGARYLSPEWVVFGTDGRLDRWSTIQEFRQEAIDIGPHEKVVIPGFFGFDHLGDRHLLGRGGSDRTGALAALGLTALYGDQNVVYENWTDQDGICTDDPRKVQGTHVIAELTRREVREGAHGGSGVLQGDVIVDLNGSSIPIVIRNTFNLDHPGTRILVDRVISKEWPVVALSGRGLQAVSVDDLGMADAHNYLRDVMGIAAQYNLSIEYLPAAQDAFTLTLHEEVEESVIEAFAGRLRARALSEHAEIDALRKGVVCLIGEALTDPLINASVLGHAAILLAENTIGIDTVVSHPGSPSLALLIEHRDVDRAQQLLHDHFIFPSV